MNHSQAASEFLKWVASQKYSDLKQAFIWYMEKKYPYAEEKDLKKVWSIVRSTINKLSST